MLFGDYTTAVSRASALSDRLLTKAQVERMLSAATAEDAFRVLFDLSWASSAADASSSADFERVIEAGLYELKSTLANTLGTSPLALYLFLPFDLQNAKASLAAFAKGKTYDDIRNNLSSLSFFPRRTAWNILTGKTVSQEAMFLQSAVLRAKKMVESSPERIGEAENILDAAVYKKMGEAAKETRSTVVMDIFSRHVEWENIKKIMRTSEGESVFFLDPSSPDGFFRLSVEQARRRIGNSDALQKGDTLLAENASLSLWEVEGDLHLIESLFWKARTSPMGPENIILLFLTKLRNAEVIRSILVGKRNGFSAEEVRSMVAPFLPFLP